MKAMTMSEASIALLQGRLSQKRYDVIRRKHSEETLAALEQKPKPNKSDRIRICTYKKELGIKLNREEVKIWNSFCNTF